VTLKLAQLGGMIRYEARMHWRRGGLLAFTVVFAVALFVSWLLASRQAPSLPGATTVITTSTGGETVTILTPSGVPLPSEIVQRLSRAQAALAILDTWLIPLLLLSLAVPPIVAETIPLDRQAGVRELLDGLPLSRGTYLLGKLLGVWVGVLSGLVVVAALTAAVGQLLTGPFDPGAYLVFWGLGIVPLALFTSAMGTLLPVGQPTRRRGVFVGVAFSAYCVATFMTARGKNLWDAMSLARPTVFFVLRSKYLERAITNAVREFCGASGPGCLGGGLSEMAGSVLGLSPAQAPLTIGLGALQVAVVWLIVWVWMRWKEGR